MEIIQYQHEIPHFTSKLLERYFPDMKMGIFDIETLGLNPSTSKIILAGIMNVTPDGFCQITQYFASTEEDEKEILTALAGELKNYDYLLTYNGKHFDIPFLEKRASINGISPFSIDCHNLDLYLVLHGHSDLKQFLPNLRQKTVEDYMGFHVQRKDEISGAESIRLYKAYQNTLLLEKRNALKKQILLHNHDDLLQLYKILPIIQKTEFHRAMSYLGFPVPACGSWPKLNISKIRIDFSGIRIHGTYGGTAFSYLSYDTPQHPYTCRFSPEKAFEFLLPADRHKGNYFVNLKYYLKNYESFLRYPNYINGFLLLFHDGKTNFMEMNFFVKAFLRQFMETTPYPAIS